ncbi:MAG: ketoacyl-synthetase C-terminal extension domain-containing protein, partial [bacterium]|nr:ketoacyl-synthetase C-terminal extension domain-containing protein [bacterium]
MPSILAEQLNSNINWQKTPFKVQQTLSDWKRTDSMPRIAGISSFGAGGSNAHLIVSEPPDGLVTKNNKSHYLFTLSAQTEQALKQRVINLLIWLEKNPSTHLESLCYTLNAGRSHFEYRCAGVASSIVEVIHILQNLDIQPVISKIDKPYVGLMMQQLVMNDQKQQSLHALAKLYCE